MKKTVFSSLVTIGVLLTGCGPKLQEVSGSKKDETDTNEGRRETVAISVGLQESSRASFGLTSATDFKMSLEGCASGLSFPNITKVDTSIDVYKFDRGCLVKLSEFQVGGIDYEIDGADPFTSWLAGDVATFQDATNAATKIRVVVTSQLGDPISGTEAVTYSYSQIVQGSDQTLAKNIVSDEHSVGVTGQDATAYTVQAVSFTGITAMGAGQFVFTMECPQNVTGTAPNLSCEGVSLNNIKYRLVRDTYNGTLTLEQAAALFNGTESSVADPEKLAVGAGGTTRGGFTTKTGAGALTGPDRMAQNPQMLLVIQIGGISYRYFNVDVTTLSY